MHIMTDWHDLGPFTVFDLETTGFSPRDCRIIDIGAVRLEKDGTLSQFESLVNPNCPIPPQVVRLTHITDEMVSGAPNFTDAAYKFMDFCKASKLVAHHAVFDLGFLQESLSRCGLQLWQGGAYDLIPICKQAFPQLPSYSLEYLCQYLSLSEDAENGKGFHRASYDAEMEMEVFCRAMDILSKKGTDEAK